MSQFSVVSWNVNSINARVDRVLAFLDREKPDYLCLQELKCSEDKFPFEAIQSRGYHCAVHGQKTYNGVAILSRRPTQILFKNFADGDVDDAARAISIECHGLKIINFYVPNGQAVDSEKYNYKLRWLERARSFLHREMNPSERIVLLGDFNIAPDDRDVYDPIAWKNQILCSPQERSALSKLVSFGFVDTLRMFTQEGGIYTWWDYREAAFIQNKGLRIDMIYATPTMALQCKQVRIDRDEREGEKPSDHAPVIATFNAPANQ